MTSDESSSRGVVIPMWAIGIIGGGLLMVGGWSARTILDVRDQTTVLAEKVRAIEVADVNRATLPLAVARLEAKLDAMTSELQAVREDIRRVRPSLDVRGTDGRR